MKNLTYFFLLGSLIAGLFSCGRPVANFSYEAEEKVAPVEIRFKNESKKAESYEWDFGDGATSEEANPVHKYSVSGSYTITLKAKKGEKVESAEKELFIEAPETCLIELETEFGKMTIQLYDATPLHRDNFIKLVEEGFYDGLLFHRVIQGFMIQGGDPGSRDAPADKPLGMGGPGYQIPAEFVDSLIHVKGALSAARTGDAVNPQKKSSGSQFYIVQGGPVAEQTLEVLEARKGFRYTKAQREAYTKQGGTPHLDGEYTVFGRVIDGLDVIDKIAAQKTDTQNRPRKDIQMKMRVVK